MVINNDTVTWKHQNESHHTNSSSINVFDSLMNKQQTKDDHIFSEHKFDVAQGGNPVETELTGCTREGTRPGCGATTADTTSSSRGRPAGGEAEGRWAGQQPAGGGAAGRWAGQRPAGGGTAGRWAGRRSAAAAGCCWWRTTASTRAWGSARCGRRCFRSAGDIN